MAVNNFTESNERLQSIQDFLSFLIRKSNSSNLIIQQCSAGLSIHCPSNLDLTWHQTMFSCNSHLLHLESIPLKLETRISDFHDNKLYYRGRGSCLKSVHFRSLENFAKMRHESEIGLLANCVTVFTDPR